jgi:hypothetical protein
MEKINKLLDAILVPKPLLLILILKNLPRLEKLNSDYPWNQLMDLSQSFLLLEDI